MGCMNCYSNACTLPPDTLTEAGARTLKSSQGITREFNTPSNKQLSDISPLISKIQALWRGYTLRKQYKIYKNKVKSKYIYFSPQEARETLNPTKYIQTFREHKKDFTYKSGAVYTGEWCGGFRDGYGAIEYPDGSVYTGFWSYGQPYGQGKFTYIDGESYEGDWKCPFILLKQALRSSKILFSLKRHVNDGYCKQYAAWLWIKQKEYPTASSMSSIHRALSSIKKRLRKNNPKIFCVTEASGSTFTGCCKHNKPHKIGLFKWKDGRTYLGEWSHGEMQGVGEFSWPNGRKYFGFWKGSLRHGFGTMHYRSGTVYQGYFDHDRPEGGGVLL